MIYRSPLSSVDIPDVTVTGHVLGRAAEHGDRVALVDAVTGQSLTYSALAGQVSVRAAGLVDAGLRPGDVVGLMSHNQPDYAVALHAVLAAGGTVTPINPVLTPDEIRRQLVASRARMVICSAEAAEKVVGEVRKLFVIGRRSFDDLRGSGRLPAIDPRTAVALLPFSSGTTGTAKGVVLTHRNLVANLEQTRAGWLRTGDLARVNDEGRFWVVDRLKELIKYKGYQVAPAELEALLRGHEDVVDAAVVGVPHDVGGEAPKAFVVAGREVEADALMAWVAERVAPYKKVREVEFVPSIPRSPTGKILRRLLRASTG